ncbi:MAG: hypothetical protein AAGI89_10985 [Pseudomonadota bacterium]
MNDMDEDFFDEADGEYENEPSPLKRGENAVAELYDYISQADWENYDPKYFDQLVLGARAEIKERNFEFDGDGEGLLNYERRVFNRMFKTIPLFMSFAAAIAVAGVSSAMLAAGRAGDGVVSLTEFMTASGVTATITAVAVLGAALWRSGVQFFDYVIGNKGEKRLRDTRDYNVHIIERTLSELSGVVAERAVNEEPLKGASGLIQTNLTFIAEYNIRKAIKRCRSLFNIKIEEVDMPDIKDTQRSWASAFFVAVVAAGVAAFAGMGSPETSSDVLTAAAPFLGFLVLPTLAGLAVQSWTAHAATKPGSFVANRWDMLREAYEAEPSDDFITAAGYRHGERDRVDFSYDMAPERVHVHARWLLETLTRYEKLKNRRMMD